jgi:hypothetical protein
MLPLEKPTSGSAWRFGRGVGLLNIIGPDLAHIACFIDYYPNSMIFSSGLNMIGLTNIL